MKRVRIRIEHKGCFTQLQREVPDLRILDINLGKPQRIREKIVIYPRYLSLRGRKADKQKFLELCRDHRSGSVVFESSELITDLDTEPTVIHYESILIAKPSFIAMVYSSDLRYPWPLIIKVRDGLEELVLEGTQESIESFKQNFEKEDIGEIYTEYISEKESQEERRDREIDKRIACGLHFFTTLKDSLNSNVMEHRHASFLKEALLDSGERNLRDICEGHGIAYGNGRQMVGKAKKGVNQELKHMFQVILSDLEGDVE
jgi:hypothetical protein